MRSSGILLHPTSLPGRYGIGDLGKEAYRFVDILEKTGQSIWQVLPLGPTGYGDSPYQCFSAFAGNPLLVSPDLLIEWKLLGKRELKRVPKFPTGAVDFGAVIPFKQRLLRRAFDCFKAGDHPDLANEYSAFCARSALWLDTYALFHTLKIAQGGRPWNAWERELATREPSALASVSERYAVDIEATKFAQFLFFKQWDDLKRYANSRGVRILGDAPIFVAYDSADVWAHRNLFKLDETGSPTVVAGVPPDYFSKTGQLWGNPLYDWNRMRETGFSWWIDRIAWSLQALDMLRLDHFRGFSACWEVPASETTAINGRWVDTPGSEMFAAVSEALGRLPIVAEDLGVITQDVDTLRDRFGFPGMRVMQFGFGGDAESVHLPHNYNANVIAYTATHDNNTTVGWFNSLSGPAGRREKKHCLSYLGTQGNEIQWDMMRAVMSSVAGTTIVPLQDLLGLDERSRMNSPGRPDGNWTWRVPARAFSSAILNRLRLFTELFGRTRDQATP